MPAPQSAYEKFMRVRYYFIYTVLAFLVAWVWWTSVISVYLSSGENVKPFRIYKNLLNEDKVVVLTCSFELYTVPAHCLFNQVCGCSYWLPISVLAWRRLGYKALVLTVGEHSGEFRWVQRKSYFYTLKLLEQIGNVQIEHINVNGTSEREMAFKMVKIYSALLITKGNPYVIFSKPNIFPLSQSYFELQKGQKGGILAISPNARCCKRFLLDGNVVKLFPDDVMVGALLSTWKEILGNVSFNVSISTDNKKEIQKISPSQLDITVVRQLYDRHIEGKNLNQIKIPYDKVILSILINNWLRLKGVSGSKNEKDYLIVEQPPRYKKGKKISEDIDKKTSIGSMYREFPITAQSITGWSEVYPVAAELFDSSWLDLTEYWINFTNIVNSEPNVHPRGNYLIKAIIENGIRFFPLPKMTQAPIQNDDRVVLEQNLEKQENFQYVAFFDEDEN